MSNKEEVKCNDENHQLLDINLINCKQNNMDEQFDIQQESMDEVGNLTFAPPPMKKSDTRDSISSIDSDVSLSFDRRDSKSEEADFSDIGTDEPDCISPVKQFSKISELKKLKSNEKINENDNLSDKVPLKSLDEAINLTPLQLPTNQQENAEPIVSDELAEKICAQVEFYFSDENIIKDAFLLKHVKRNKEGYVSLKLISSFKRVKHLSRDWRIVGAALRAKSTKLEVNELGTKLRRRDPLPQYDQTLPSRTIIAAKLPVEKLTIETVAEIFSQFGEIALIRILRPGNPVPAEIRQAISKRPELGSDEECALIEFTDSAAAREAQKLNLDDAKIYQLQQITAGEKKRKQQLNQQQQQQQLQQIKKNITQRNSSPRENIYSSSCPSGSEEENKNLRIKSCKSYSGKRDAVLSINPYACNHGPPSIDPWFSRRFSACTVSGSENNPLLMRRLSTCSNSSSNLDNVSYSGRRFSSCSSESENNFNSPLYHISPHQSQHNLYPPFNYWPGQSTSRRYSCCTPGNSSPTTFGYNFDYMNSNSYYHNTSRRGSAEYSSIMRRLSTCSRDSGYDPGSRRLSSCSSGSDSCSGIRSRSNSGFVLMAHLPENITRLPSGPDGTRGFGRNNSSIENSNVTPTVESSCA